MFLLSPELREKYPYAVDQVNLATSKGEAMAALVWFAFPIGIMLIAYWSVCGPAGGVKR